MTARHVQADEETPLLRSETRKPHKTPLPWGQFTILLILQLAEPLTSQVIYPFAPELIRNVGITHGDETKVGYYVGVMQSIFFATQAVTVLHWSRVSDHVGRKPTVQSPASLRKLFRRLPREAAIQSASSTAVKAAAVDDKARPLPLKKLLVPRVIIPATNYAFLAIVDINLRAIQPVFYSTPIALGGLGLAPQQIGWILSVYGVINGLTQIFLFSKVNERFGSKPVYLVGIASVLPVFAMFPFINEVARLEGRMVPLVWGLVFCQALLSIIISFSYGAVFIFITASAPNKASLGAVNGIAQMLVSLMRTVGPATANSLFSLSIDQEHHYMGGYFVYYALSAIVLVALWMGTLLPNDSSYDLEDKCKSPSPSSSSSSTMSERR
ncbi:hypothetical protein GSI_02518 [Ganoderma sinense ZZ0214-1]|uniref:MFS general substrate transporter n=1 Tax=Ganoderma sinense ZZ0214-1 TaxID=1077348 RepID=A0A2G8SQD7_9APHY|nr:hypothetical protein GSI_02518 [Ganoderma sinense ZZ0214-1]